MPTTAPMPTVPVGVSRAVPTASSMPTAPSAYMDLCRRLFYAYGLPLAVGIAPFMPTGAVGIDSVVGKPSFCWGTLQKIKKFPTVSPRSIYEFI